MRRPSDMPSGRRPRRQRKKSSNRGRIALIVIFGVVVVLFLSARGIAGFYTDYLWYDALGYQEVWSSVLGAKIALAALFTAAFFVMLMVNLVLAGKLAPRFRAPGPEEEFIERYQQLVGRRTWLVNLAVSLVFALVAGVGVSGQWRDWILFTNRVDFGVKDEQFGLDIGFYVFQLPFLSFVVSWLFAAIVIIFIITTVAHYLNGGIRVQVPGQRVTPQVKAHLSVLLAVLALLKAAGYWLQRYQLTLSSRGTVDGATYTDVNAQLPAINLLVLISLGAAVLLIVNIWQRGWRLPVIAVGLWGVVAVVAGAIYPEIIQRFVVQPAESSREAEYISRNIRATRQALGLQNVETMDYEPQALTADDLDTSVDQLENVRLLDPSIVLPTFQSRQATQGYYQFTDLDVDRYEIEGNMSQVVLSVRELNPSDLPQQSWVGRHLAYTHGYGVEVAPADRVRRDGFPVFLQPTPDTPGPTVTRPEIYFGEDVTDYAVVATEKNEISLGDRPFNYDGDGGVGMGSRLRRFAFALRFSEPNLLLSGDITGDSRILYVRDVRERVELLAPFLEFDADPYPVLLDGRVRWVVDGYTTTNRYPYAQDAVSPGTVDSGLNTSFNYVRNSVKATVDAYDGTVDFYVVDDTDPLVRAYAKQFPGVFKPRSEMPDELEQHLRYPEDLFRVQTSMWGRYHVDDENPAGFYQQNDSWNVSQDPGSESNTAGGSAPRIPPFYGLMQLPTAEGNLGPREFVLMRPFVPVAGVGATERPLLVSFMTASSDPENYGELRVFRLRNDPLPPGPSQVLSEVRNNPVISEQETLLGGPASGSEVRYGNQVLLPVGNSMIYVTPMYVASEAQDRAPSLRRVIVSRADGQGDVTSAIGATLEEALDNLLGSGAAPELGGQIVDDNLNPAEPPPEVVTTTTVPPATETTAPPTETTPTTPTAPADATVASLLAQADAAFVEAEEALRDGDLATYQAKVEEARLLVQQATALAGGGTATTTAPSSPTTVATTGSATTSTPSTTTANA